MGLTIARIYSVRNNILRLFRYSVTGISEFRINIIIYLYIKIYNTCYILCVLRAAPNCPSIKSRHTRLVKT